MKYIGSLLISTLSLVGCVSSNQVTTIDQYAEIAEQGRDYRATITLQAGSEFIEREGDYVTVTRDSVRWLDPGMQSMQSAATADLRQIRFTEHCTGAGEGCAFGAIPGILILIPTLLSPNDHAGVKGGLTALGLVGLGGGAIIGATTGAIFGHKTDYIFPAP